MGKWILHLFVAVGAAAAAATATAAQNSDEKQREWNNLFMKSLWPWLEYASKQVQRSRDETERKK